VVFVPGHVLPLFCAAPGVVTIHDLGHLTERSAYRALDWWYLELTTRWMAGHARRLIAVSQTTARDLERAYRVSPERIRVVRSGVDESMRPQPPDSVIRVRQRYGLPDTYFLYVGRAHPRKNLPFLLRAFEEARRHGVEAGLVLAGPGDAPAGEGVRRLAYVPPEDLPALYSGALALLLPSRFEGFGFPVLEAMACGTAVVASSAGALPEIAGDAGILLPPDDLAGWVRAISDLAKDKDARRRLIERGLDRAPRFSWPSAADAVWDVLEEAAGYASPREPETAFR
jgi:glycosyltransferase involved in cell wall biosynthesis